MKLKHKEDKKKEIKKGSVERKLGFSFVGQNVSSVD